MRRLIVLLITGLVVAACNGDDNCFDSDGSLRDRVGGNTGIYGATPITTCGSHCPPDFSPFCPQGGGGLDSEPTFTVKDHASGTVVTTFGTDHGAYGQLLARGVYDVCLYDTDCRLVDLSEGGLVRVDANGVASAGGWYFHL